MKRTLIALAAIFALFGIIFCGCSSEPLNYKQVTQAEAQKLMETKSDYIILDVRTQDEYKSGHIKGAICIPNEEISGAVSELPDKKQLILVYCRSGRRSKEAAQKLADSGYTNIVEFGGINDWQGETVAEK